MPQVWYTLCEIKRDYAIASLNDVIDAAKQAGVSARKGGAKVSRPQLLKMHPYLMKKRRKKELDVSSAKKDLRVVYDSSEERYTDYLGERASAEDLFWLLNPKLEYREDDDEENTDTGK